MLMWQMFCVALMLTELQLSVFQLAPLLIDAPLHTFAHFYHHILLLDLKSMTKKVFPSQVLWIFLHWLPCHAFLHFWITISSSLIYSVYWKTQKNVKREEWMFFIYIYIFPLPAQSAVSRICHFLCNWLLARKTLISDCHHHHQLEQHHDHHCRNHDHHHYSLSVISAIKTSLPYHVGGPEVQISHWSEMILLCLIPLRTTPPAFYA